MITKEQECYLFIADKKVYKVQGDWPDKLATHLCSNFDNVICVSLYSNTIKFLKNEVEYGERYARTYKEIPFNRDYYELVEL